MKLLKFRSCFMPQTLKLGLVVRKRVSSTTGLNFQPTIAFTSLKIDLGCYFGFMSLGFLEVYFSSTLERLDVFKILVTSFA